VSVAVSFAVLFARRFALRLALLGERHRRWRFAAVLAASVALGGALSVALGIDSNYDLRKYHVHNPWAALNDRLGTDFFAAGTQTYYQPLLDIPYYLLATGWLNDFPRVVTFLMGVPAGLLFALTLFCVWTVLGTVRGIGLVTRHAWTALAGFFGLTSAPVIFQIGSLTNEVQTAVLVVGAVAALLHWRRRPVAAAAASGALLGLAAGAKLTALLYTPTFLLAFLLACGWGWRERARVFVVFSCAWWVLFLAAYGWWGWALWRATGNPMFPFFNNVFRSELLPAVSFNDPWFRPASWREALFYPFYWVNTRAVSESFCTDTRYLFTQTCVCVTALFALLRFLAARGRRNVAGAAAGGVASRVFREPRIAAFFALFLCGSYVFWEKQFSILRYTVPLSVFLGLLVVLALAYAAGALLSGERRARTLLITSALLFFCAVGAVTTRYPHWGRLRGCRAVFEVGQLPKLPPRTLLFFAGPEAQYLAPFFARRNPDVVFSSPGDDPRFTLEYLRDSELTRRLKRFVAGHDGPVCVLTPFEYRDRLDCLPAFGLTIESRLYQAFRTNYGGYRLYLAKRKGGDATAAGAADAALARFFLRDVMTRFETRWTADEPFHFDAADGWGRVERDAGTGKPFRWSSGGRSTLAFFVKDAPPARRLVVRGRPFGGQPRRVVARLNGREVFNGVLSAGENVIAGAEALRGLRDASAPAVLAGTGDAENTLEFLWLDAVRYDNRPWPEGPRPGWGDQRVVSFAVEEIALER